MSQQEQRPDKAGYRFVLLGVGLFVGVALLMPVIRVIQLIIS